jgi:hypothetical protein
MFARWLTSPCYMPPARLFLKKLKTTLKIPVLALVDSDPYGLKILSVYMKVWEELYSLWVRVKVWEEFNFHWCT